MSMIDENKASLRGDTLVEVLCAVAIFSLITVSTLSLMNQGSGVAQRALEITQVRSQIAAQAEALRFLNASYIAHHQPGKNNIDDYTSPPGVAPNPADTLVKTWLTIRGIAPTAVELTGDEVHSSIDSSGQVVCPTNANASNKISDSHFVLNPKTVALYKKGVSSNFQDAETFARIRYGSGDVISSVDGLWIEAVTANPLVSLATDVTEFIDFNIWACWSVPGQAVPSTISTKVRLYDPR